MKLPQLIKTLAQLRKVLRSAPIENKTSWEREGPCPQFLKHSATEIMVGGKSYVVFMPRAEFEAFWAGLIEEERENARSK